MASQASGISKGLIVALSVLLLLFGLLLYTEIRNARARSAEEAYRNSPEGIAAAQREAIEAEAESEVHTAEMFVRNRLRDPSSAQFLGTRYVRKGGKKGACGFVNARNGFGGMAGNDEFAVIDMTVYLSSEGKATSRIVTAFCGS